MTRVVRSPAPFAWLRPDARRFWRLYRPGLEARGRLIPMYQVAFAVLCETAAVVHRLDRLVAREGLVIESRGRRVAHPAVRQLAAMTRLLNEQIKSFGLTPQADERLLRAEQRQARAASRRLELVK